MDLILTVIVVLLANVLVLCVPGAGLLAVTRLDQLVPPPLVPGAALVVGMVPMGIALSLTLWLELPIVYVAAALAVVTLACWAVLAGRSRGSRTRLHAWSAPVAALVAGRWARAVPIGAWLVALATLLIALTVGFNTWNDSLYHIGQAQKLLALDHPNFDNTLQFPNGTAHPGYLVPLWQEMLALTAWVAHVNPVTAAWIIPGVTVTIGALSMGGLGWALARTPRATVLVMLAWLTSVIVATMPFSEAVFNALQPGEVALDVMVPLVLALLFTALWPTAGDGEGAALPSSATTGATVIMSIAAAEIALLHISYLMVLALGIVGYLGFWALRAPWPRAVVWRHVRVLTPIAVSAAATTAALLPGLSKLQSFGKTAKQELALNSSAMYEGKLGAPLEALLRGGSAHFHLRPDYLVLGGGLALVGLLCVPIALLAPRWPAAWYLGGSTLLVLVIAISDRVFPVFVHAVSLDQARRIENVLPLPVGLALGAAAAGVVASSLWRRGGVPARGIAGLVLAAAAGLAAWAADSVPQLGGYGGARIVSARFILAPLGLLLVGAALYALALLLRLVRRPARLRVASWEWPTETLTRGAAVCATCVLLVGALPLISRIGDTTQPVRRHGVPLSMREAELRLFSREVTADLRKLPTDTVLLADPSGRNPYYAMALAPIYVVSSVPRHTATTPGNHVERRFNDATEFFQPATGDARRLELLRSYDVTAVIIHPNANPKIMRFLTQTPGITPGAIGKNQRLFHVEQAKLPHSVAPAVDVIIN